jgi:hypothetical protein
MAKKGENPNREFIERWRRAGPELERIRKEELRNYDYNKNLAIIDSLLQLGVDHAVPRTTSGLVELQKLLHKRRK